MKATEANLLKFLRKSPQFVIPIYQRNYSWTEAQCRQLWTDLMRAGQDDLVQAHFIGSIVYVERGLSSVTSQEALLVIDGQQRLTTSTLLIAALAEHFEKKGLGELLETFSSKKLRNYYLLNPDEEGERHFKLILSETDKDTLLSILQKVPMPNETSMRIMENYALFKELIAANEDNVEDICVGLGKLVIVDVSLDRAQDNPQMIFESMNSTGLELSQADLIRNYILMGVEHNLQTKMYKTYWRPMEKSFGQDAYGLYFDPFMRHYLTAKTGEIPNVREVYSAFKKFARAFDGGTEALVADIHAYAGYYCAMALDKENIDELRLAFNDLRDLKVDVVYPFLLDVYHDYKNQRLTSDDVLKIVRLVESYIFRRAVCGIGSNSQSQTFAGLSQMIKKEVYVESVEAVFLLLPSYRRFPGDKEFQRDMKTRDLYNFARKNYWLYRLENHARKERVSVGEYTVEHIMPQNEVLSAEWQLELGADWQKIQHQWLHTLGNLTLTGYNSEYGDKSFSFKRDAVIDKDGNSIGFASSPIKLNASLTKVTTWDEAAIKKRATRLALDATKVWIAPTLSEDILEKYRSTLIKTGRQYSLSDHPSLTMGVPRTLFAALRKEICAMDPCVSEEFWKSYIAYKAEKNIVAVVPRKERLRLELNINISELIDPEKRCRDISNIGRASNGSVEIGMTHLNDLPYIMRIIQQVFDAQMGSDDI